MGIKLQSLKAESNLGLVDNMTDGASITTAVAEVQDGVESEMSVFSLQGLTAAEQARVDDLIEKINLRDSNSILNYGRNTQRKLGRFADTTLQSVLNCNVGIVSSSLERMVRLIDDFDKEIDSRSLLTTRKAQRQIKHLQAKYDVISRSLTEIQKELMNQEAILRVDIDLLSKMYDENLEYCKELTLYILAGRKKLEETHSELDALSVDFRDSFEQQIVDLELSRAICLSMAPQIRMIQRADERLVQKIQSSINNTIPLWKQNVATSVMIEGTSINLQMILNSNNEFYTAIADTNAENRAGERLKAEAAKHMSLCVGKIQQTMPRVAQQTC